MFHLFSIGEGVAYGSSTINYLIAGAPVSAFQVALSEEYLNVEFIGKDVRNWQKTTNGYLVQLHTPVSGPYTLLATCERTFKAHGDTLTFTYSGGQLTTVTAAVSGRALHVTWATPAPSASTRRPTSSS